MSFKIRIILPLVGLCLLSHLTAQERSNQGISRIIDSLVSDISYLSDSLYGTDFSLINGEAYRNRHSGINGHPYYLSDSWLQGSVRSGEQEHQGVWLKYDIFDDRVILNHTPGSETFMIALNKDEIGEFTLEKDHFIQLYDTDVVNSIAEPGYYQELYTGKMQFIIKWKKYISGSSGLQPGEFISDPVRLVRKDGVYYKVSGRSSLLRILEDHKDAISAYIRSNAIAVRNAPDSDLVRIFRYYDSLISTE